MEEEEKEDVGVEGPSTPTQISSEEEVEEKRGSETDHPSSREVHRQVLAYFKHTNRTFGPFDDFSFNGETGVKLE